MGGDREEGEQARRKKKEGKDKWREEIQLKPLKKAPDLHLAGNTTPAEPERWEPVSVWGSGRNLLYLFSQVCNKVFTRAKTIPSQNLALLVFSPLRILSS